MAVAAIYLLPVFVVTVFTQRGLVRGLMTGATKEKARQPQPAAIRSVLTGSWHQCRVSDIVGLVAIGRIENDQRRTRRSTIPVWILLDGRRYKEQAWPGANRPRQGHGRTYRLPGGTDSCSIRRRPTPQRRRTPLWASRSGCGRRGGLAPEGRGVFEEQTFLDLDGNGIATFGDMHGAWFKDADRNISAIGDGMP